MEEIKPMWADGTLNRLSDAFGECWNDLSPSKQVYIRFALASLLTGMGERLPGKAEPLPGHPDVSKRNVGYNEAIDDCLVVIDLCVREIMEGK